MPGTVTNTPTRRLLTARRRRLFGILSVPVLLVGLGTVGYMVIEPAYGFLDALYMTVITLSTIGYGEVHPLSAAGRVFTIVLIFGGVFTLAYTIGEAIRTIVSGELRDLVGRQRMEQNLAALRDHLIVCGFGRLGQLVCQEFTRNALPFVLVEQDSARIADFELEHGIALHGDATSDEVLKQAGIERARVLVSVVASDADNLYITMSARLLNDKLFIVARAEEAGAEQKLLRAGANRVVSPYQIGGARIALAVLRPAVVDFIELATRTEHFALQIEEIRLPEGSPLAGATLKDSRIRSEHGVMVVAIQKANGHMLFNPSHDAVLAAGDTLIAIGDRERLDQLERVAKG